MSAPGGGDFLELYRVTRRSVGELCGCARGGGGGGAGDGGCENGNDRRAPPAEDPTRAPTNRRTAADRTAGDGSESERLLLVLSVACVGLLPKHVLAVSCML